MHGAWAFDLLLMIVTTGVTVLAFRQFTTEHEESRVQPVRLHPISRPESTE